MSDLINLNFFRNLVIDANIWIASEVITVAALWQAGVILITLFIAKLLTPPCRSCLERLSINVVDDSKLRIVCTTFISVITPTIWVLLLWGAVEVADTTYWPNKLISIVVSAVNAVIIIIFVAKFVNIKAYVKLFAIIISLIAILNIFDLLHPALNLLDGISVQIGEVKLTVLSVSKGLFYLIVLLWLANLFSRIIERKINSLPSLTPSVQVLLTKFIKIFLVVIAGMVAINAVGVDLTAFAVFGGALGVGIGFGLQKIVANFVSGIILLLDKSIKPGDTIGVSGTYGWIQSLGARYVSVVTRDGIEHLIPNEELITTRVENWSFSNLRIRQKIPIGVSYNSDIREAINICSEAALENSRVLDTPSPICLLKGFGDSSVDLEVRFWVVDPQNGLTNVKSEILLDIWDRFNANGIEIPFPQRDIHLKTVIPEI
ncbi:MAG: mechanosensitive ion channel [Alphaproteobacteria bacterium]|nr:mechanosensitive ion channel [Alphaproteobacteria bacterium]